MLKHRNKNDANNFFKAHHMYIKTDYNRFALYSLFSPMEPFGLLFLLYAHYLLGNFLIAGLLLSLEKIITLIMQILFSGMKDKKELKYILSAAEFFSAVGYFFFAITPLFVNHMTAVLCIGILFTAIAGALWSGTYDSFIYEDFEKDRPEVGSKPYSKLQSILYVGSAISMIVSSTLAGVYSYAVAMWFGVIANIVASVLALSLKGPGKKFSDEDEYSVKPEISILHFFHTTKKMLRNEKLKYITIAEVIRGGLVASFNSFTIPYYKTLMPIAYVGYIATIKEIIVSTSFNLTNTAIKKVEVVKAIKFLYVSRFIMMIAALVLNNLLSPMILVLRSLFFGPMKTSLEYTMQSHYSHKERVAMASTLSVLSRLLGSVLIILLGFIAQKYSIIVAMSLVVPFYIIPYILYNIQFRIIDKN